MPAPDYQQSVDSFVATVANIAGSPNQLGTATITDSSGNVVKIEKVALSSSLNDYQATVDSAGTLAVAAQQDATGAGELSQIRRLLEALLFEMQTLNQNFLGANPGITTTNVVETSIQ